MTEIELAYIAGILDGEGCIYISRSKSSQRHKDKRYIGGPVYALNVIISNTYLPVLQWVQESFGGSISAPKTKTKRICYRWVISARKASDFLVLVLPYMRIKKKQAELAVEFQTNRVDQSRRVIYRNGRIFSSLPVETEELVRREHFCSAIGALNQGPNSAEVIQ